MYYAWFWQTFYFQQFLLGGLRVNNSVNIETIFHILLVVICITLNVKPLKKCMYFWIPRITCTKLTFLYINYRTNGFVPVVWKMIVTNNSKNFPNYIVSIITCSCCRFRSNCEWDFYDPIHTIKKHALAHVFATDFFVIELSTFGALWFHFPSGAGYLSPYIGFVHSKIYIKKYTKANIFCKD